MIISGVFFKEKARVAFRTIDKKANTEAFINEED